MKSHIRQEGSRQRLAICGTWLKGRRHGFVRSPDAATCARCQHVLDTSGRHHRADLIVEAERRRQIAGAIDHLIQPRPVPWDQSLPPFRGSVSFTHRDIDKSASSRK